MGYCRSPKGGILVCCVPRDWGKSGRFLVLGPLARRPQAPWRPMPKFSSFGGFQGMSIPDCGTHKRRKKRPSRTSPTLAPQPINRRVASLVDTNIVVPEPSVPLPSASAKRRCESGRCIVSPQVQAGEEGGMEKRR